MPTSAAGRKSKPRAADQIRFGRNIHDRAVAMWATLLAQRAELPGKAAVDGWPDRCEQTSMSSLPSFTLGLLIFALPGSGTAGSAGSSAGGSAGTQATGSGGTGGGGTGGGGTGGSTGHPDAAVDCT